jgi:hypothetical protein
MSAEKALDQQKLPPGADRITARRETDETA